MSKIAITGSASGIGRRQPDNLLSKAMKSLVWICVMLILKWICQLLTGVQQAIEGVLAECGGVLDGLVTAAGLGGHLEDGRAGGDGQLFRHR